MAKKPKAKAAAKPIPILRKPKALVQNLINVSKSGTRLIAMMYDEEGGEPFIFHNLQNAPLPFRKVVAIDLMDLSNAILEPNGDA